MSVRFMNKLINDAPLKSVEELARFRLEWNNYYWSQILEYAIKNNSEKLLIFVFDFIQQPYQNLSPILKTACQFDRVEIVQVILEKDKKLLEMVFQETLTYDSLKVFKWYHLTNELPRECLQFATLCESMKIINYLLGRNFLVKGCPDLAAFVGNFNLVKLYIDVHKEKITKNVFKMVKHLEMYYYYHHMSSEASMMEKMIDYLMVLNEKNISRPELYPMKVQDIINNKIKMWNIRDDYDDAYDDYY